MVATPTPRSSKKSVAVVEILCLPAPNVPMRVYDSLFLSRCASLMPQAVSAWCRRLGHNVTYRTYCGGGTLENMAPNDVDVIFISSHTEASLISYALSKMHRSRGALTVCGGPHARAFPADCLRHFDIVVADCSLELLHAIISGDIPPGVYCSAKQSTLTLPPLQERYLEVQVSNKAIASLAGINPIVPMLASTGCPYECDFCVDWDKPYRVVSPEALAEDVRWLSNRSPRAIMGFHDPNFGVRFDDTMAALEGSSSPARNRFVAECSLSVLNTRRLERLRKAGCLGMVVGIESWTSYSNKTKTSKLSGLEKIRSVLSQIESVREFVPFVQTGLIVGLPQDNLSEMAEQTMEFAGQAPPGVWIAITTPIHFGGTPLYRKARAEGTLLESLPFAFYCSPNLLAIPRRYSPSEFFSTLARIFEHTVRVRRGGLATRRPVERLKVELVSRLRTIYRSHVLASCYEHLQRLRDDRELATFLRGETTKLPAYYKEKTREKLGPFYQYLAPTDLTPLHDEIIPSITV